MDSVIVEVRSGEGGMDAKDLVLEQTRVYKKFATRNCL